jgi:hypothetical protein
VAYSKAIPLVVELPTQTLTVVNLLEVFLSSAAPNYVAGAEVGQLGYITRLDPHEGRYEPRANQAPSETEIRRFSAMSDGERPAVPALW